MWYIISREGFQTESCVNDLETAKMLARASSEDTLGVKLVVMDAKSKKTMAEYLDGKELYSCAEA